MRNPFVVAGMLLMSLLPVFALAAGAGSDTVASVGGQALDYARGTSYFRMAVMLTLLSFIPVLVIATTAFTRIVIVLSSVRLGLGLQEMPPNIVLVTLALFLTAFVMTPTLQEMRTEAFEPYMAEQISSTEFIDRATRPLERFMLEHTREQDLTMVSELALTGKSVAGVQAPARPDLSVLVPAFMLSELRVAFQMAFMVLLPFLLIDLIIAVTLMALGMMMVPPTTISLPIKILMFVLVDGWIVLARSLVDSFAV